jgi:hypothetical protein
MTKAHVLNRASYDEPDGDGDGDGREGEATITGNKAIRALHMGELWRKGTLVLAAVGSKSPSVH